MGYSQVRDGYVDLARAGIVEVQVDALQGFSSAPLPYGFILTIDGIVVFDTGRRTYPGDIVHFSGRKACGAGRRYANVQWAGDPGIVLQACALRIMGYPNTQG